jgi:hypothetical protein
VDEHAGVRVDEPAALRGAAEQDRAIEAAMPVTTTVIGEEISFIVS